MSYLDLEQLEEIPTRAFRDAHPYPWINPAGLITEAGHRALVESLPDVSGFKTLFGVKRLHGQQNHDRYALEYSDDLALPAPWKSFAEELRGTPYRRFLARMFDTEAFDINMHWHYTPNGCSVSPHCDARRKIGSHIFYFNTERDWKPNWGGETLVLDDGGRLDRKSAPRFEDFDEVIPSQAIGNYSLLFAQGDTSWHGVREITCPDDHLRKVFIVVVNRRSPSVWVRRALGRLPKGY